MVVDSRGKLKRWAATAVVVCATAAAVAYFLNERGVGTNPSDPVSNSVRHREMGAHHASAAAPAGSAASDGAMVSPDAEAQPFAADSVISGSASGKTFEVDTAGKLVRNEQARLNIEALVALTPPEQLRAAAQAQVEGLPASAAAEALELVERYDAYQAAQKLSYAPGTAPLVPEEALAELDGLHALRVSYFGQEGAKNLFGKEETMTRQLLEWMRQDNAPGLTMEQRAMRAQARYDAMQASRPAAGTLPR